ncbi:hypothetical protein Sjap_014428 [Stephania japonica]|uniref:Uncharacterized protein n=1 Tax=Stephania japonica TaxID=461633 RepID=A0AAP0NT10_9MAGN
MEKLIKLKCKLTMLYMNPFRDTVVQFSVVDAEIRETVHIEPKCERIEIRIRGECRTMRRHSKYGRWNCDMVTSQRSNSDAENSVRIIKINDILLKIEVNDPCKDANESLVSNNDKQVIWNDVKAKKHTSEDPYNQLRVGLFVSKTNQIGIRAQAPPTLPTRPLTELDHAGVARRRSLSAMGMTAGNTTAVTNIPATSNPPPTVEHTWKHLSSFFTNCGVVFFCPVSCDFATVGPPGWATPLPLIVVIWGNVGDSSTSMWVPPNHRSK